MIRKVTVQLTIIHLLFSSDATYNNKQMVKMMYEYFSSSKNSPSLMGHSCLLYTSPSPRD